MNKIKTSTKTTVTKVVTKEIQPSSKKVPVIICTETYVNDKLNWQEFEPKKAFHQAYESKHMRFYYYGKALDSVEIKKHYFEGNYNEVDLDPVIINDLESFNNFEQLYCIYLSTDGEMYNIVDPKPMKSFYRIEVWGRDFDLGKCSSLLNKRKDVSNLNIKKNIPQNWDISGTHSLYFDYIPSTQALSKLNTKDSILFRHEVAEYLGLGKFKIKRKDEDYEDDLY